VQRLTIVQITDCHLFDDPATQLRGVATWPRFQVTMQAVRQQVPQADLLVVTGDTAHDEIEPTYRAVRAELSDWCQHLRIIPGNHDQRTALHEVFPEACQFLDDRIVFEHRFEHWQLIGLDSQKPNSLPGLLGSAQLSWLADRLRAQPELPTVLFMHHPPVPIGSAWLDRIALEDAGQLRDVVRRHPQVQLLLTGHVHQQFSARFERALVMTTPAVGPHFRPRTKEIEILPHPPSFRVIELSAAREWSTQVVDVDM
jgi:Icc protein